MEEARSLCCQHADVEDVWNLWFMSLSTADMRMFELSIRLWNGNLCPDERAALETELWEHYSCSDLRGNLTNQEMKCGAEDHKFTSLTTSTYRLWLKYFWLRVRPSQYVSAATRGLSVGTEHFAELLRGSGCRSRTSGGLNTRSLIRFCSDPEPSSEIHSCWSAWLQQWSGADLLCWVFLFCNVDCCP